MTIPPQRSIMLVLARRMYNRAFSRRCSGLIVMPLNCAPVQKTAHRRCFHESAASRRPVQGWPFTWHGAGRRMHSLGGSQDDTIYALATPPGRGAIAVIRVSGPKAAAALQSLAGAQPPRPRQAWMRHLSDPATNELLDSALVLWSPSARCPSRFRHSASSA